MSHNLNLSVKPILKYYTKHWPIETFFREEKQNFGLARYQVRTLICVNTGVIKAK